ncbi:hypothetical protein NEUTE2DRAFT_134203 [Neurospora tetrasperma FGSC 2509]|nr:hypothetical protein NEUTE2DRAFT_134203 [Neurospora tetrasperma FGSC 2509]
MGKWPRPANTQPAADPGFTHGSYINISFLEFMAEKDQRAPEKGNVPTEQTRHDDATVRGRIDTLTDFLLLPVEIGWLFDPSLLSYRDTFPVFFHHPARSLYMSHGHLDPNPDPAIRHGKPSSTVPAEPHYVTYNLIASQPRLDASGHIGGRTISPTGGTGDNTGAIGSRKIEGGPLYRSIFLQ